MNIILKLLIIRSCVCFADCVEPLYLTPLISSNRLQEARQLAEVDKELFLGVSSYAGFLTVNNTIDSNLFFWFFPVSGESQNVSSSQKPLVVWLNGGPSQSSLMGVFLENGPFIIDKEDDLTIQVNQLSWHRFFNMLYIDQPVGTGFSFTNSNYGYVTNMTEMADQLYIALVQFYLLFPWLQSSTLYLAGESFAGKYIPAIAHKIYEENDKQITTGLRVNLQGLAMGNALTDPINMLNYADFAYQLGFIDDSERVYMQTLEEAVRQAHRRDFFNVSQDIMRYFLTQTEMSVSVYNVIKKDVDFESFVNFVNQTKIKTALHVPDMEFNHGNEIVRSNLLADIGVSAMPMIESLLDRGLRVMYFNGNLDFIVGYPLSVNAYRKMNWSGSADYLLAKRQAFHVNGELGGFVKKAKNFAEVVVLNAGHCVSADQPHAALKLMRRFVADRL